MKAKRDYLKCPWVIFEDDEEIHQIGPISLAEYQNIPEDIARLVSMAPVLLEKLELAEKYLRKAIADHELQGCVIPIEAAHRSIEKVINYTLEGERK